MSGFQMLKHLSTPETSPAGCDILCFLYIGFDLVRFSNATKFQTKISKGENYSLVSLQNQTKLKTLTAADQNDNILGQI